MTEDAAEPLLYRQAMGGDADSLEVRNEIVEVCRLMHQRGLIAASDGNVSVRLGAETILVTPSGARKGFLRPEDLVLTDLDGRPVSGQSGRPSSELAMHTAIYAVRDDVRSVVHAHPPCAIAHTVAGVSLSDPLMPEVFCLLGEVTMVPYTTPTTHEVPDAIQEQILGRRALMMERHGSITVGGSLAEAYDRLEVLEHAARISYMARTLAPSEVHGLQPDQLAKLRALAAAPGVT